MDPMVDEEHGQETEYAVQKKTWVVWSLLRRWEERERAKDKQREGAERELPLQKNSGERRLGVA